MISFYEPRIAEQSIGAPRNHENEASNKYVMGKEGEGVGN